MKLSDTLETEIEQGTYLSFALFASSEINKQSILNRGLTKKCLCDKFQVHNTIYILNHNLVDIYRKIILTRSLLTTL
jgi:hypothetical protein